MVVLLCVPVIGWQTVQGVPCLLPEDSCDRHQLARNSCEDKEIGSWMDGHCGSNVTDLWTVKCSESSFKVF